MKKDRFGKSKGPLSKVEIEREAQRELERLSRGAGARPAFTPPGGPPTALDDVADSVRGRSAPPPRPMGSPVPDLSAGPTSAPQFGGIPGGRGAPPPSLGPNQPFYDDDEEAADESANVTEIALRDHAARFGSDPEDLVIRQDPFAAEMMRDQAMRQFLDQQQSKDERPQRGPVGDPVTSVLNRLAARKKAEEEALARGDDGSGETVLDRIRARREAFEAEVNPPPPRQLHDEPGHRGRGRGRPPMTMVDDDGGEESALAIMRARAEARRPRPPTPSRVFAVPAADDPDDFESEQDEQLEGDDDEFADEDETLELDDDEVEADEDLDEDEDDYLDAGSNADGPPTPDFAAEVARLSGGRTMGSVPARNRPKPAASSKRDAARRTSPAAPKRQATAPVTRAPVTKAPGRSAATSKARPTKAPAPGPKVAVSRGRSTKPPATKSRTTSSGAPRPTAKGAAKTTTGRAKATSGAGKASTARTQTPRAPAKAPPAPKAKTPAKPKAVPAKAKAASAKAKAVPAKATAAPKGNGAASAAAAKKAAARARIADAAKRSRSSR